MRSRTIENALQSLKRSVQPKSKGKRKLNATEETLGRVTSYLNGSALSLDAEGKLSEVFRKQLPVLYAASPRNALEFASTLCKTIYEEKIIKALTAGKSEERSRWEGVLNAVLSGVLDHQDEHQDGSFKEIIGSTLYPILCSVFSSSSISQMGPDLRCTGYSVLSESADGHRANQKQSSSALCSGEQKVWDEQSRLSRSSFSLQDYLAMESILNLFARMIPPSGSTASGRAQRRAFIRSVFTDSNPDDPKTGEELAHMVEHVSTPDWEQTATRIIETLAASNIGYPQPFSISEVVTGEAKPSDRIFVDEQGFLANVLVEDDLFDSLTAPYSTVKAVEISQRPSAKRVPGQLATARTVITLSTPAKLGQKPIGILSPELSPQLMFTLGMDDVERFRTALNSRGIGHVVNVNMSVKQSISVFPATLEMDFAGNLIDRDEVEHRAENLSQLYGTNDLSDDQDETKNERFANTIPEEIPCIDPALLTIRPPGTDCSSTVTQTGNSSANASISAGLSTAVSGPGLPPTSPTVKPAIASRCTPISACSAALAPPMTPVRRTASQALRENVFGASDDELSPTESPPGPPKISRKPASKLASQSAPQKTSTVARIARGRRVLDSDDEMPVSTPTKLPPKSTKKAVPISDDEIEDVLHATRSLVSRRRSALPMTPVTPAKLLSSRRQSVVSKAASIMKQSDPASGKLAVPAAVAGSKNRPARKKTPVCIDVDLDPTDDELTVLKTKPVAADPVILDGLDKTKDTLELDSGKNNKRVRMSSPLVQPVKKSIKASLRKKGQPLLDPAQERVNTEKTKRKRTAEDESTDRNPEATASKKIRLSRTEKASATPPAAGPQDDNFVFKPDSAKAKKQYRAKKVRTSSPAHTAVDFDTIPDPTASVTKSNKTTASKASKKGAGEPTANVSAAAKVPGLGATEPKAEANTLQEMHVKAEVGGAPPPDTAKVEKAKSKRKPAPKKAKEAKPVLEVDVKEKGKEESPKKDVAILNIEPDVRKAGEEHISPTKKSKKAPWESLHVEQVKAAPVSIPAPVDPPVLTPPVVDQVDSILNATEAQPAVELDDFNAEVAVMTSTPPKKIRANVGTVPVGPVQKLKQHLQKIDDGLELAYESPMKFATPSPLPINPDMRNDAPRKTNHEVLLAAQARATVTFEEPETSVKKVISPIMKPQASALRPALRDKKLEFAPSSKPIPAKFDRTKDSPRHKRPEPTGVVDEIAAVLQDIQEAGSLPVHCREACSRIVL
ncbi:uncharacterized protein PHACADRAFT_184617 [Phanerochaete carnosa HHB-10118-sp]|uniref:Uncharacterized protein n=1 Tax=Phanerochaete carnosa (strain HHB-10118-sp) TaxID=650164 RepID=K5WA84_PHACS|nr:uncharacterized protein PHACADRAFT_184617 [Phanerochaete carnosa HHB-10118-sp]EKM55869.1 hypothetical protein PHACADRAFT_184617 [Phanerochaete carnosa HHB-10118-sp]